ncbi:MAG TPA: hypothetical protein VGB44_04285 [Flavobacterium sp.]|jgi:hypothetical protein
MFQNADADTIEDLIEEIYDKGIVLSNYFSADLNDARYFKSDDSIVIEKEMQGFSRLYFMTADIDDLASILQNVTTTSVINFPTTGSADDFEKLMNASNFSFYKKYEIYSNEEIKGNDAFVEQYAQESDFEKVKSLLYEHLDVYSDHLPNDEVLMDFITNQQVLVNYLDGEICGVLIFTIQGKNKCYLNFWVDTGKNGLFLLFNIYNLLKEKNISYSYLWVNSQNEKVKRIHKLLGSKPTGTADYIYINKNHG